jgi:adenylate cyclase
MKRLVAGGRRRRHGRYTRAPMTVIAERTILFADLRGSTSLYEQLGNAEATSVVTHTVTQIARGVTDCGGQVVKTLGDGLMAVFVAAPQAVRAAQQMHAALERLVTRGSQRGASSGLRALRLQVALARGEVVEMGGDWFGDAVNVAARLLDHAGDNETLITDEVLSALPSEQRTHFRSLDWMHLRGRAEPVHVHLLGSARADTVAATQFGAVPAGNEPDGIRLVWAGVDRSYTHKQLPLVLGRSPQSGFQIGDPRVSRSHARIDWQGGVFQLTDLSYNGTYVSFGESAEVVSLRRGVCTLHGSGRIGLGGTPGTAGAPSVRFEVLRYAEV